MSALDLNIDLGEIDGEPEELFAIATTANVACGGHAGDRASMERAVRLALLHDTQIAAHPSYPDRAGFGRRTIAIDPVDLAASIEAQCAALAAIARALGRAVTRVKPHGALYHDAGRDRARAEALIEGAARGLGVEASALTIVGARASRLEEVALDRGARCAREGFADRGYRADGSLVPRGDPGALITDPEAAAAQAIRLSRSGAFDTLCVHGDTEGAVAIASRVRAALTDAGLLAAP